ncbi:twin-arginine translocation signal domain-containing protein [Campylobacter sp. faydin G-24]|uniref:Twin-arginine translocation signal domain-containing protein n=1 Tax=Campylobacter anatolicus TaxID=2829105 RepID=A0ABS5HGH7_9BACT|nr:twin-arginine translocation signal domain-containing protein [Campylobacter anatolicus]MBR8461639.1 twin-arginine translocation signal domain-containing protein [Campylobacter anatolicus]MBR8463375.1 twin-arginine translocation signal domain-containing protein [Campylobacter anatolicus]MBR8465273.1 twin-arginine translocation signal domain-containing protein [Campylobacter anatolicus]
MKSRREFLKKLMVGGGAAALGATAVVASNGIKSGESKSNETLYKRTKTWEFYYKQAK